MSQLRRIQRERDESGAYLALYALLAVAVFTMAAIVLDITALRQGRTADRATADIAAAAGALELDPANSATFEGACIDAWNYVVANSTDVGGATVAPLCAATFPSGVACTAFLGARTATGTIGPITVEITHPVPDLSGLMLAEAQGGDIAQTVNPGTDGNACERLGIRIRRSRTFLFGQIAGLNGGTTDIHAVARGITTNSTTNVPSVVALEPSGCDAITTGGPAANFWVGGTLGPTTRPGIVVTDSTGATCGAPGFVIDPNLRRLTADGGGFVSSFAITSGNVARAYNPADVPVLLAPSVPVAAAEQLGRGFIDRRYNCTFAGCPVGSDFINQIRSGPSSLAGPGLPPTISNVYPLGLQTCAASPALVLVGDWYVDCAPFVVPAGVTATFTGGRVVFRDGVLIQPGGHLVVGSPAPAASNVVYLQKGNFTRQFLGVLLGQFTLNQTMLYLTDTGAGDGLLEVNSDPTSPNSVWTAPNLGGFEDLLLWTEATGPSFLRDTITAEGTFFLPNATFELQDQTFVFEAQVVVKKLRVIGDEDLRVFTDPARATGAPIRTVRLLR